MRYYEITVRRKGCVDYHTRASSLWSMRAVLVYCYYHFFGRAPLMWWACKKVNMGQAWSRKHKPSKAAWEIEISQLNDWEFAEMKRQQAAHTREHGPYLLTASRAA